MWHIIWIGVIAYIAKHGKVGDFNYCGVNHKDNSGKYRFMIEEREK